MKKAGMSLPCLIGYAGYFLSIEDFLSILSDDFFLPSFFLPSFFLPSFLSILVLLSDFFSILPPLSCASAAKLVAANIAATRTATSCFMSSPSLVVGTKKTGLKERSPSRLTRQPDNPLTIPARDAEVVVNQPNSPAKGGYNRRLFRFSQGAPSNGLPTHQAAHRRREDPRARRFLAGSARAADHSLHRGRRHRRRYHAGDAQGGGCGGTEGLRRQEEDRLDGDVRRREVVPRLRRERLAARGDVAGGEGVRGLDQGPAHHAGGRRHPLDQRRVAPGARPVRVPAAGALVQGCALAAEGAGEGRHGDLSRELRGHLCRHRVAGAVGRGEEGDRLPDQGDEGQEDPLSRDFGDRHQAGVDRGLRAPDPQGVSVRDRE